MEYFLDADGFLISKENKISLMEFIENFKKTKYKEKDAFYSKEQGAILFLFYEDNGMCAKEKYKIILNDKQKEMFENKKGSAPINFLLGNVRFAAKEKTIKDAKNGILPLDSNSINAYKDYLDKEILKTRAIITLKSAIYVATAAIASTIALSIIGQNETTYALSLLAGCVMFGPFASNIAFDFENDYDYDSYVNNRSALGFAELLKKLNILLTAKEKLNNHIKDINFIMDSSKFRLLIKEERVKNQDQAKEYNYELTFEIEETIGLIDKLPLNLQEEFLVRVLRINYEYTKNRIKIIDENNQSVFGEASETKELTYRLRRELISIKNEIIEKIRKESEKTSLLIAGETESYDSFDEGFEEGTSMKMV